MDAGCWMLDAGCCDAGCCDAAMLDAATKLEEERRGELGRFQVMDSHWGFWIRGGVCVCVCGLLG